MRALKGPAHQSRISLGVLISLLTLHFARLVHAQVLEDIQIETENGAVRFDLRSLKGDYSLTQTRDLPPTEMLDELRFNLFEELKPRDGIAASDQVYTLSILYLCK